MPMRKNSGQRVSFPLVVSCRTGAPGSRIKMLQQKLVHAIIRGVRFQQNFANFRFGLHRAASHNRSDHSSKANQPGQPKHGSGLYFFAACASIFSITNALDPPRSYTLPLATTLSPANGSSFAFCPLDGVVSAIGQ